jgi:hypothetical protein
LENAHFCNGRHIYMILILLSHGGSILHYVKIIVASSSGIDRITGIFAASHTLIIIGILMIVKLVEC